MKFNHALIIPTKFLEQEKLIIISFVFGATKTDILNNNDDEEQLILYNSTFKN